MSGSLLSIGLLGRNQFKEALTSFPPHHAAPATTHTAPRASDCPNHAHLRRARKVTSANVADKIRTELWTTKISG
jgi:hypothetical protein